MNAAKFIEVLQAYPLQASVAVLLLGLVLKELRALGRIYFHPLSKFPGPLEAAVSDAWLYKVSEAGRQEEEFERLHELYETHALRIGPNELHISDVSKYKTIYSQSHPYLKESGFYNGFGAFHTVFAEIDEALHKERRRLLNPFFSRAGIFRIEPTIQKHINNLRLKLERLYDEGKPIIAQNAFRCVTADIITQFAFGESELLVENSDDSFAASFLSTIDAGTSTIWTGIFNPVLRKVGMALPTSLVTTMSKTMRLMVALNDQGANAVKAYRTAPPEGNSPVLFETLQHVPDRDAADEAVDILIAGSDTTAFTLTTAAWHISQTPSVKHNLIAALKEAFPEKTKTFPALQQLESIPYLTACIKESLRVANPVPGRLPRVVPIAADSLIIDDKVVPPGTVVGISQHTMHTSEEMWGANARDFEPARWLGEAGKGLDEGLVAFSKGARNCVGQPLAQAELILMFYMLYRNFDIELDPISKGGFTTKDVFTQVVQKPGVLLRMRPI